MGRVRKTTRISELTNANILKAKRYYEGGRTVEDIRIFLNLTYVDMQTLIKNNNWKRVSDEERAAVASELASNEIMKSAHINSDLSRVECKKGLLLQHASEWHSVRTELTNIQDRFGRDAKADKDALFNLKLITDILEKTQAGERRALGLTDEAVNKLQEEKAAITIDNQEFVSIIQQLQDKF